MVTAMSTRVTQYPFVLPMGYDDADGATHREGVMRLATAHDEIAPLRDPRVQANPAYLVVILLARTIVRLGALEHVTPKTIEGLYSTDLLYLQDFYQRVNHQGHARMRVTCPHCSGDIDVEPSPLGEA